jgi:hypothetical protein
MKPALRILVVAVVALGVGAWLAGSWRRASHLAESRVSRERLKRELLERSAVARQLPAEAARAWRDEVRALTRWYGEELAAIRTRYPAARAAPVGADAPREKDRDGARAEWQRYAEERHRLLAEGRYEPLASSADRGLHLDLLAIDPAASPTGGGKALRIDFALWGAPRRVDREVAPGGTRATVRTVVPVAFKQLAFEFLDARGMAYGEMSGPGEPYQKLADPERFEEDFLPGVLFGTWYVDAFPREAARAVLTLAVEARGQSGADVTSTFKFDLPVPDAWRLAPGETYQAEIREAAPKP